MHDDAYQTTFNALSISSGLSTPDKSELHLHHLGGRKQEREEHGYTDSEVYGAEIAVRSVTVHRLAGGASLRFQIIKLGECHAEVLATQWPAPYVKASSFLSGDPNAPLVVLRASLDGFEVTETVVWIERFLAKARPPKPPRPTPSSSSMLYSVPRIVIDLKVRDILGRLLYGGDCPGLAFETRSDSFSLNASTQYQLHGLPLIRKEKPENLANQIPLCMTFGLHMALQPTFIRLRRDMPDRQRRPQSVLWGQASDLKGDPVISMDLLEVLVDGSTCGGIEDTVGSVAYLDNSTTVANIMCTTDAFSVELWQPEVMSAVSRLVSLARLAQATPTTTNSSRPSSVLDSLPKGLCARFAAASFTVFVTSPDPNPDDGLDLSRGIALRTGINVSYYALRRCHVGNTGELRARNRLRRGLDLPEERIVEAVASASASTVTAVQGAFMQLMLRDPVVRSAVATRFIADDPYCENLGDITGSTQDFLRLSDAKVDLSFYGKRNTPSASSPDYCHLAFEAPYIQAVVKLVDVLSLLLAAYTIRNLAPRSRPKQPQRKKPSQRFIVDGRIDTFQLKCEFPLGQKLAGRIDGIGIRRDSVDLDRVQLWVPVISNPKKASDEHWEQCCRMQHWTLALKNDSGQFTVAVIGDSAHIRIPYNFLLSELIRDISLSVKSMKHLHRIVSLGQSMTFESPEAEEAKVVPNIGIKIRYCVLEAADDPFEVALALIWQAGAEASAIRTQRDEAFQEKVASILAADGVFTDQNIHSTYNFTQQHSVSVEAARQRLHEVHSLDWIERYKRRHGERTRQEQTVWERLWAYKLSREAPDIPNIVESITLRPEPGLIRATLTNINLCIAGPSFPLVDLPSFINLHGSGVPKDMRYSLLVPLHISLSTSSLRLTLRDYQLPLINVSPSAEPGMPSFEFETDLVIAEEMGTNASVEWTACTLVEADHGVRGASPFVLDVPKTIMPVKTYAIPSIRVSSASPCDLSWAVSYGPALQDVLRILDTVTSSPRDPSPPLGFWDKVSSQAVS
jgi:hypothetical protein